MLNANLQPPYFGGFLFMGVTMYLGQEIEQVRIKRGLSIIDVCNILNMTESEYRHFIAYGKCLSNFYLIMFMNDTRHTLYSI